MPPPLDKNLYTLSIEESKEESGATDLFDADGVALYRRRWGDAKEGSYAINIFGQYYHVFINNLSNILCRPSIGLVVGHCYGPQRHEQE